MAMEPFFLAMFTMKRSFEDLKNFWMNKDRDFFQITHFQGTALKKKPQAGILRLEADV